VRKGPPPANACRQGLGKYLVAGNMDLQLWVFLGGNWNESHEFRIDHRRKLLVTLERYCSVQFFSYVDVDEFTQSIQPYGVSKVWLASKPSGPLLNYLSAKVNPKLGASEIYSSRMKFSAVPPKNAYALVRSKRLENLHFKVSSLPNTTTTSSKYKFPQHLRPYIRSIPPPSSTPPSLLPPSHPPHHNNVFRPPPVFTVTTHSCHRKCQHHKFFYRRSHPTSACARDISVTRSSAAAIARHLRNLA
jgi:hypothetical protein